MRRPGVWITWRRATAFAGALTLVAVGSSTSSLAAGPVLSGTMRVRNFVVKRGETRVLRGPLKILASGDIEIDGKLLIEGSAITLHAGHTLRIGEQGGITPVPTRKQSAVTTALRPTRLPLQLSGDEEVQIGATVRGQDGQSIVAMTGEDGTILVYGRGFVFTPGALPGRDAGDIILEGYFGAPNARVEIDHGTHLITGNGGEGGDDKLGLIHGVPNPCQDAHGGGTARQTLRIEGGDGGNGGTIRIRTRTLVVRGHVTVGKGGRGGNAGPEIDENPETEPGHGGMDVYAKAGNGGDGGSYDVQPRSEENIPAGAGGAAGSIDVGAGDGAEACDGGRTTAVLGSPGRPGQRGLTPKATATRGSITLAQGGIGGSAHDPNHDAGDGGNVTIQVPRISRRNDPNGPRGTYLVTDVRITTYANGGVGDFDCREPRTKGTDGGAGGKLDVPAIPYTVANAFNGRDGGDGGPPGKGGRAGTANRPPSKSSLSFLHGPDGTPCNEPVTPPPPPPPATELFKYAFSGPTLSFDSASTHHTNEIVSGEACGGDPLTTPWSITAVVNGGAPFVQKILLPPGTPTGITSTVTTTNGVEVARVTAKLTYAPGASPSMTLGADQTGQVSNLEISPSQVPVTKTPVASCP